ncbi:type I inositol polyphosphate 5-phosphatase 4-like isoform X1 [Hibiscus syriacus]|uniref:type I inositol polyphosphate 5-phosphatase 4-like isoform X1 n=1 Tax=Hibiscus syriacus TaxID=106335 RepID=UPI0019215C70|nr:type I inositol polyphosphate 5-phosphatase 4-like isoform X1 [Hibiscus syriacus]
MDDKNPKSSSGRFRKWFKRKHKKKQADPCYNQDELSDGGDDFMEDVYVSSFEMDPCTSTNELSFRIFVGTWNVAGRSPVGSLAVDLEEWLKPQDAVDIYVIGFQEIVPLKTRTVIGAEDPKKATNWNLLIGKALNESFGRPWLTPMLNPISSDSYHYAEVPVSEKRASFSAISDNTPMRRPVTRQRHHQQPVIGGSKYKLMASKKMVGVFISVWMKKELLKKYCVSNVKVSSVACGIMGYLGNKGSVSVSMLIEGTSFCFIAAHLASGEKQGDEGRRNHQVTEIFKRTSFPRSAKGDGSLHPLKILGHDQIFWFGDLNYRLYNLEDNLARHLIKKQDWKALQEFDELRREQEDGVFQGWREGNIEFAPTYKYSSSNCNRYSGGLPYRSGEKQRTPAWCDRILWYGKGVKILSYLRSEIKFSDHRPVSALFSTQIEVMKSKDSRFSSKDTSVPNIMPPEPIGRSRNNEEGKLAVFNCKGYRSIISTHTKSVDKPNECGFS